MTVQGARALEKNCTLTVVRCAQPDIGLRVSWDLRKTPNITPL
jgi:hypothetical protein